MAYLHCHTKDCGWSQDDFWNFRPRFRWKSYKKSWWKLGFSIGYNPISKIGNDISWLWKPKWMSLDKWIIDDMTKYTGVNVKVREVKKTKDQRTSPIKNDDLPDVYVYYEFQVFSTQWLWVELVAEWKNFRRQKWWTWKQWQREQMNAVCPKCGLRNFDID